MSRQILLNRDPDEATSVLLETCDSLMKGLDAARYSDNMRLYSEIYDLLIKTAALIDRLRAQ